MIYWRSMTLPERAAYTAKIAEWFPQVEITFFFDTDFPSSSPGTPDTYDNTLWRIYRNGVLLENYVYTYCQVEFEGEGGIFHAVSPETYREIIRDHVIGDSRVFAPFSSEPVPSSFVAPSAAPKA
jgi:hypothetical protein